MNVSVSCYMLGEEPVIIREELSLDTECVEDLIETLLEEWDYVTIEKSRCEMAKRRSKEATE